MTKLIVYTVKKGDTLTAIARAHNTTVFKIVQQNKIADANKIRVGQVLSIPVEVDEPKNEIKEALAACLSDVEKLDSFKKLEELLNA
jgi:LysM repeat protein